MKFGRMNGLPSILSNIALWQLINSAFSAKPFNTTLTVLWKYPLLAPETTCGNSRWKFPSDNTFRKKVYSKSLPAVVLYFKRNLLRSYQLNHQSSKGNRFRNLAFHYNILKVNILRQSSLNNLNILIVAGKARNIVNRMLCNVYTTVAAIKLTCVRTSMATIGGMRARNER